ncbi:MAG: 3-oxoacyl-[acyl-carrier-protein] reductase [Peptoniphilaceae bacterium]
MENKTVLITGASRGIGRVISQEFAKLKYNIVINYRNEEAIKEVEEELKALGGNVVKVRGDISNIEDVEYIVKKAIEEFGQIDILINNAGITKDNLTIKMTEKEFNDVINVNLKGSFYFMKFVSKYMINRRRGKIISISSIVALRGNPGQINYSASKAGLIAMTKTLALELSSRNITCNCIAPGYIDTDMTNDLSQKVRQEMLNKIPLGKSGDPIDVANAVLFLASSKADYITGQVISVDGGMSI